jgi:hypothetical protein
VLENALIVSSTRHYFDLCAGAASASVARLSVRQHRAPAQRPVRKPQPFEYRSPRKLLADNLVSRIRGLAALSSASAPLRSAAASASPSAPDDKSLGSLPKGSSWKTVIRALGGNIAIASLKFWSWHVTKSSAMLAEALHTSIDTANQALLLYGLRQADRPADASHPCSSLLPFRAIAAAC